MYDVAKDATDPVSGTKQPRPRRPDGTAPKRPQLVRNASPRYQLKNSKKNDNQTRFTQIIKTKAGVKSNPPK